MRKGIFRVIAAVLAVISMTVSFPIGARAATRVEASINGDEVSVRGTVRKNLSGDGFEVKDQDCGYLSMAVFDLSLMAPVTDATILELTPAQKSAESVSFETKLQMIAGFQIDISDPERYVLLGTFEKAAGFLTDQKSGSQFSYKLDFTDFTAHGNNEAIVEINRIGYIARDEAALTNGPNDDLPAVGKDGLYLRMSKDTEVMVLYKGNYTYKIEYDGRQYYTLHENIRFSNVGNADVLADNIRKIIYQQSMLADYYMYGVSDFDFNLVEGGEVTDVIELTREQLMNGQESVEKALKALLKKEKNNGVTSGEIPDAYLDAVIEEDPMDFIGQAANDLYSQGRTEAVRQREEEMKQAGDNAKTAEEYETSHGDDILKIEINKEVVGEILGKVWDSHLSDEIMNAPADEYGTAIAEKIYGEILGWDNRLPRNYEKLIECYTGNPDGLSGFDVLGDVNWGNDYADIKGSISQDELLRKYGGRLSGKMQEYIRDGSLKTLPFNYQTKNVSGYNRFLPGSLVIFEVVDFRVLSVSKKQYLGVYVGNGEFYLPGYSDSAFDTLCSKLDGIERTNGLIKIIQDRNTRPLDKNANYGFLWLCHRNISVKNVYEADIALLNDPKYSTQDNSYFPMTAMQMSQIRYREIAWQMENNWRPPKVWND